MPKREVLDDEGKPIDSTKNLGAFLQKIGASPEATETPAAPSWETVKFEGVDDPDLKDKTGKDAVAVVAAKRKEAETATQRAAQLERELEQERRTRQMEDTTRRVLAEQQAQAARPAEEPKPDPREAQIDELWFTDAPAARALLQQLNDERTERRITAATNETKQDVMTRTQQADLVRQAQSATEQATAKLLELGVSRDALSRRAHLVMSDLANPVLNGQPNKWFYAGGPTKVENIVGLWEELFGLPKPPEHAASPAQQPAAVITPPPGSARPAAAAAPAKTKEVHIDATTKRDYERMAQAAGLNPEKLIERRRKRLEGDAHA